MAKINPQIENNQHLMWILIPILYIFCDLLGALIVMDIWVSELFVVGVIHRN